MMSTESNHYSRKLEELIDNGRTGNDVIAVYDDCAQRYEKESVEDACYNGPQLTAEYFQKHAMRAQLNQDAAVLDIGAGTGLLGQVLRSEYGYTCIDAVDGSAAMLEVAKAKSVYRHLYTAYVDTKHPLPMAKDSYDAVLLSGAVIPGHIKPDVFPDLIRVTKSGGLIVNCMRESFLYEHPEYDLRPIFSQWETEGLWTLQEWAVPGHMKHYRDFFSLVQVYRVT